jgi:hypothetical protein
MKTTLELPEELVREIKLRAIREGRKLKEAFADLLRKGLQVGSSPPVARKSSALTKDKKTGLPLVVCLHPAPPGREWTPNQVAELLLEQEVRWHHDASR